MSTPSSVRSHAALRVLALGVACVGGLLAMPARADDPTVVITRTVHPRIATRALPVDELPIHAEATTFPQGVFQGTLSQALAPLVGDADLGETGSAGLVLGALGAGTIGQALAPMTGNGPLGRGASGSGTPFGPGASIGGAVGRATGGLGDRIGGAVMQAVSATKTGVGP